jgi:HEAT repeat protein
MSGMRNGADGKPPQRRGYRAAVAMVALTAAACLTALLFRTPLRSRTWAHRVITARGVAERAAPLTCLCNAGDGGRWGTAALLTHPDQEIRQYGVVVLQHVKTEWARQQLLTALTDPSEAVREMAALGLALHGDDGVIPVLEQRYLSGDAVAASGACLALERLATPRAAAALRDLAGKSAGAEQRAALVEALAEVGGLESAAGLLELLDDHRPCTIAPRAQRMLERFGPLAAERGWALDPAGVPATRPVAQTVAERAADALKRITGLTPPFRSDLPDAGREEASRTWREWISARETTP